MKPREKMLAIAVGAVVVLFGLKWGYDTVSQWFIDGDKKIAERTAEKDKADAKVRAGREAERRMASLQQRSLPANSGQTNYQLWLISVANKDLKNVLVDRGNVSSEKGATARGVVAAKDAKPLYEKYRFHIKAVSDLKMTELSKFLYDFYAANHLHTIRNLSLIPDKDKLTVSIDVEAMMLPAATDRKELLKDPLGTLALGDSSTYQRIITGRDLFERYTDKEPVRPPAPPSSPPPFDIAKYTKVTAIKSYNDEPEIDVTGPSGHHSGLKQGSDFKVGDSTYKVLEIGAYDAVLLVDGKDRKRIKLGDVLRDALPVSETPPTGL